jgi:hypothetical protein
MSTQLLAWAFATTAGGPPAGALVALVVAAFPNNPYRWFLATFLLEGSGFHRRKSGHVGSQEAAGEKCDPQADDRRAETRQNVDPNRSGESDMSTQPVDNLERQATEQRLHIHATAEELKGEISEAKNKFKVERNLLGHLFAVSLVIGVATLLISTVVALRFKR